MDYKEKTEPYIYEETERLIELENRHKSAQLSIYDLGIKGMEMFSISIAVLITLFTSGHIDMSLVVIAAASVAATLATAGLYLFSNKEGK